MNEFIISVADFFLPRFCPACNKKLKPEEKYVCPECLSKIKTADEERLSFEYKKKFEKDKIISGFSSLFIFEKEKELQSIIHALKYNRRFLAGSFLGMLAARSLSLTFEKWNINLILPIPLHPLKKAERGYNQSFYITKALSTEIKVPFNSRILKRIRFTSSQTIMTLKERRENVLGAFKVTNMEKIKGRNILLIDDVITTGATISECGKVLLNSGANKVYAASVAIAD
jgi:ComF family protein